MRDVEQLLSDTAALPLEPIDPAALQARGARRRTAKLGASFAGAAMALSLAVSLIGDNIPTSAPVIVEVPDQGEIVDAAPDPADRVMPVSDGHGTGPEETTEADAALTGPQTAFPIGQGNSAPRPETADGDDWSTLAVWDFEGSMAGWSEPSPYRTFLWLGGACAHVAGGDITGTWSASDDRFGRLGMALNAFTERCAPARVDVVIPDGEGVLRALIDHRWSSTDAGIDEVRLVATRGVSAGSLRPAAPGEWARRTLEIDIKERGADDPRAATLSLKPYRYEGTVCTGNDCDHTLVIDRIELQWREA